MSVSEIPLVVRRRDVVYVRVASPADHPVIRSVIVAAYAQYEQVLGAKLYTRYLADLLDLDRHSRLGQLLVAEVHGAVVASIAFYPDASVQGLGLPRGWAGGRALAVHPDAQGHGAARALIAATERLARRHGAPAFAFHSASFMSAAVAMYDRLGYARAPEFDRDLGSFLNVVDAPPVRSIAFRRDLGDHR
ncbi:MAG TPA: GNAT family N-acetyltransferase [Jatrophihabitans sp.]|nr:GNAT family N-acetyltransferase [Jatrophihabitans sp.]